jgi:transcriptional regulator GlxA family with amidase domain
MDYRARAVIASMLRDLPKTQSVDSLALAVGLSASGLRVLFKRTVGVSPGRFLKKLRLEHARALLLTQSLSVKQIMAAVGYSDESHFVRDFQRAHGLSPRRYRQVFFAAAPIQPTHFSQ